VNNGSTAGSTAGSASEGSTAGGSAGRPARSAPPGPWPTRISGATALGGLALVVIVAVGAVVAVPRFLSGSQDGDVYRSTSLVQPAQVAGLPRLADGAVTEQTRHSAEQLLSAVRVPLSTRTIGYGRPDGVRLTVVTGRPAAPLTDRDITSLHTGFTSGMQAAGATVKEIDPDPLGGWFGCGQVPKGLTLCLALDAGAALSIVITASDASALTLAQAARRAVETRTPSP
jgi:hypothetical protein